MKKTFWGIISPIFYPLLLNFPITNSGVAEANIKIIYDVFQFS